MPTPWQRDLDTDRKKLLEWLRSKLPDGSNPSIAELVAPAGSGFSNDTLLFDLSRTEHGREHCEKLVVRIQPTGFQVFPEYDLEMQFKIMDRLGPTDVPVPKMLWFEPDPSVLGAAFYVMEQVPGRAPSDHPPYHTAGWMHEIRPDERSAIWWGAIDAIVKLHRLDPYEAGFGFLARPELGTTSLEQQLAYYERYLEWAARGRPQPIASAALEWLKKNQPAGEPTVLVWGDARIGNILYDGTRAAAVLDWEMATLGSPEMDLAWTIFLDRYHSEGIQTPRLEGFPSYEETVARYETLSGHKVRNLDYYQVFAGFRFCAILIRIAQQIVHYELMDAEAGYNFEVNNPVTRLTAKLLDLPSPGSAGTPGTHS